MTTPFLRLSIRRFTAHVTVGKGYLDERLKLRKGLDVLRGALVELSREVLIEDVLRLHRDQLYFRMSRRRSRISHKSVGNEIVEDQHSTRRYGHRCG